MVGSGVRTTYYWANVTQATGTFEREAAIEIIQEIPGDNRAAVGADKVYDTGDFVNRCRANNVVPHVAQKKNSAIDARTIRHEGQAVNPRKRKKIEEILGWLKTAGYLRKTRNRGVGRVQWIFTFAVAAYNLIRIWKLLKQ